MEENPLEKYLPASAEQMTPEQLLAIRRVIFSEPLSYDVFEAIDQDTLRKILSGLLELKINERYTKANAGVERIIRDRRGLVIGTLCVMLKRLGSSLVVPGMYGDVSQTNEGRRLVQYSQNMRKLTTVALHRELALVDTNE